MNEVWKLIGQGLGLFAVTFGVVFWILEGAPVPYVAIKMETMKPDPRVPTFQPVESRLGHPEYLQEEEPEKPAKGDDDARRVQYQTSLEEALDVVDANHCDLLPKKILAVAVTAYLKAKRDDWDTPLDKQLGERLSEMMLQGHLTREDFKNPPALFNLGTRASHPNNCGR